jgi:hypothetical protein
MTINEMSAKDMLWKARQGLPIDLDQLDERGELAAEEASRYLKDGWVIRWVGPGYWDGGGSEESDQWGWGPVQVIEGIECWEDGPNDLFNSIEEAKEAMDEWLEGAAEGE